MLEEGSTKPANPTSLGVQDFKMQAETQGNGLQMAPKMIWLYHALSWSQSKDAAAPSASAASVASFHLYHLSVVSVHLLSTYLTLSPV